jgi:hypothetical protein
MEEIPSSERRVSVLHERIAALERTLAIVEKTLEINMHGEGGVMERLKHLDACVDRINRTIWQASGAISFMVVVVNILIKHF